MNENRSFLVTLLLAIGSGVVIGLFAFGMGGKGNQPVSTPTAGSAVVAPTPSAPSPSTSASTPEPMAPVQYDNPDGSSETIVTPDHSADPPKQRPVLM